MMNIDVKKAICLDENLPFPKWHRCNNETSSFCISSEELNVIDEETAKILIDEQYLVLNKIGLDQHLLYLCKHCIQIEKRTD